MTVSRERKMANDRKQGGAPGMGIPIAIGIGTAMLAGAFAGYNESTVEAGGKPLATWIGPLFALAIGAAAIAYYFRRHADWLRSWSPRKRLYWISLLLAGALGFVTAILLQSTGTGGLFNDDAISPAVAILLSLLWTVGLMVSLIIYHRNVDDHEMLAYRRGGLAGFYAFIFPCPVWWVLARADLAPPVEAMPLFALSLTANALAYLWFKFR